MIEFFSRGNPHPSLSPQAEKRKIEMEDSNHNETVQAQEHDNQEHVGEADNTLIEQVDAATTSTVKSSRASVTSMPVDSIIVENRYRKDLGDLSGLKNSMRNLGLLHPIVVTADRKLRAGQRRLEAAKQLGWTEIPVRIIDLENVVQAEYDENVVRMDFSPLEALAITEELEPKEREKALQRKKEATLRGKKISAKGRHKENDGGNLPQGDRGKTRDKVAAATGYSATSLRKVKEINEAASENPEKYGHLLYELENERRIEPVYKKFKEIRDGKSPSKDEPQRRISGKKSTKMESAQPCAERVPPADQTVKNESHQTRPVKPRFSSLPAPTGCELIVVNAPWQKANPTSASPMSIDEIALLPVSQMAGDNCILLLRTPSPYLPDAYSLLKDWGFYQQDVLTWMKPEAEPGEWLRNQTEHFIIAKKGDPVVDNNHQFSSALSASKKAGTQIPAGFHKLLEEFCLTKNRMELFPGAARPGWLSWPADIQQSVSAKGTTLDGVSASHKTAVSGAKQKDSEKKMKSAVQDTVEKETLETGAKAELGVRNDGPPIEVREPEIKTDHVAQYLLTSGSSQGDLKPTGVAGGGTSEVKAIKPEQVTLLLKHSNGQEEEKVLSGKEVPFLEDWQQFADEQWEEHEKHKNGPLVSLRMVDETGQRYLHDLQYS